VAPDIGGVVHLACCGLWALTVVAAQMIAAKAKLPTNNLIALSPYLSGVIIVIITSKLRPPVSVGAAQWYA